MHIVAKSLIVMIALLFLLWLCAGCAGFIAPRHHVVSTPAVHTPPLQVAMTHQFAVPVLMYHHIADLNAAQARDPLLSDLTVAPAHFAAQLGYLHAHGYTFVSIQQIEAAVRDKLPLPKKAVAITLDDGYLDGFTIAYPLLRRYHVPATFFTVPGTVDTPGHLTWDDIRTMRDAGMHFESHSLHHLDLTTLSVAELRQDLAESKAMLQAQTGVSVTSLATPSGKTDVTVVDTAAAEGYSAVWLKGGGAVTPTCDLFHLPRVRVRGADSLREFAARIHGATAAR